MSKKTIAIIVEAIPLVSIVVFLASVFSAYDSPVMRIVTLVTSVLGILDWFATLVTFQLYAIAIFSFGL